MGGAFGSLAGAMQSFANEAAKNMKICPACKEAAPAETKFCPACGGKLPEETVAQGSVCSHCGKQNSIGIKFCSDCGAKLPAAIAEEEAEKAKDEEMLAKWDILLPQYPKWCFGGKNIWIEQVSAGADGSPVYALSVEDVGYDAVEKYRDLLKQQGFVQAGKYPGDSMLYKMVEGTCYYFESCEPFASECMSVGFGIGEPEGGFYYKAPEKKPLGGGLFDLFK